MVKKWFHKFVETRYFPGLLSILGGIAYVVQAWQYAHIETSQVDEGGYLYTGYLYLQGILRPFQDFGIPRWYAPLSYLIPGQVEKWFGPGIRTGRYLSIIISLLLLLALWLTAKRLGNRWWGVAVVWAYALSPIPIQNFTLDVMAVMVACLLTWSMMLVLGENRQLWKIVTGAVLTGLLVMTRQSMLPLAIFLVIYIFWQNGKKAGFWAMGGVLLPIVIVHVLYWPNILELWAIWLPARLTPFLDAFRFPVSNANAQTVYSLDTWLSVFSQAFRFNFFVLIGCVTVMFLWPHKDDWINTSSKKVAVFLLITFLTLFIIHFLAAFSSSGYIPGCTFCFAPYVTYFGPLGVILVVVTAPSWKKRKNLLGTIFAMLAILVIAMGLGYANAEGFGDRILKLEIPAFTNGLNPATWFPMKSVQYAIAMKFNLDFGPSRSLAATSAGTLIGTIAIIIIGILYRVYFKKIIKYSYGAVIFILLLGSGYLLSPATGGQFRENGLCNQDLLTTYEQVGHYLADIIPGGSNVYWDVSNAVPLLYVPDIDIHPAQIYGVYSFRTGGLDSEIDRQGFWNENLAKLWASEANVLVIMPASQTYARLGNNMDLSKFEMHQTASINPCDPGQYLVIYSRNR